MVANKSLISYNGEKMSRLVDVLDKDAARKRRGEARQEFINVCKQEYGYMPFTDEYLDRTWPID